MSVRKRIVWIAAAAMLVLVLSITAYFLSGSSAIESWVGSQLLQIGGGYLQPHMQFDRLTYIRPRTIVLDNLTLSSPDPAKPGQSVIILSVKQARLELTEIPRRGHPIKFSEVLLDSPEIRCIADQPGTASLLGFSHLLKGSGNSTPPPSSSSASSAPSAATSSTAPPPPLKLSDWLLIRHVEIKNGKIIFNPRTPGSPPLWLDGIDAKLDFTPDSAGNYTLATNISRKPAFNLDLQGKLNIDTLDADLSKLDLTLDLQQKNAHFLPPEVQQMLKTFEVTGQLHAAASGKLAMAHWQQSSLRATMDLTAAQVAVGDNRFAVDSWNLQADLQDGLTTIRKADAKLLGGELRLGGTIPLDGNQPAKLTMNAADLRIQKLLRSVDPNQTPLYAGRFTTDINFTAPLAAWNKKAGGGGSFTIREGRIGNIPVLGPILTLVNKSLKKAVGMHNSTLTDTADGSLSFVGDSVRIDRLDATSGAMAMRGTGTIGFNQRLDLRLNAGPLELLQNSLGALGQAWATLSDAMAGYRIEGTLGQPHVSLEIGGP